MTTREQEIERGHQARVIVEHPLWLESWATFEAEITRAWADAPARDEAGREQLWLALHAGRRARGMIETILTTGKLAQAEVENARAKRKR